jgi:hypothetical protein
VAAAVTVSAAAAGWQGGSVDELQLMVDSGVSMSVCQWRPYVSMSVASVCQYVSMSAEFASVDISPHMPQCQVPKSGARCQ